MLQAGSKYIVCTVTNDLVFDQRMQRICSALQSAGYVVTLVGRLRPNSPPLEPQPFSQVRLPLRHDSGKRFYVEYNWKLYRWLHKYVRNFPPQSVALSAIDLDTILPVHRIAEQFQLTKVYDAHELFTEMTEVKRRKIIHFAWKQLEKNLVPSFENGYTVNGFLANMFKKQYGVRYTVIRNMPEVKSLEEFPPSPLPDLPDRFILYQGAVNEGRAFDQLAEAMKGIEVPVVVAGTGNYMNTFQATIQRENLTGKFQLLGPVSPSLLPYITRKARAGLTLFENTGLNQYQSLANRFFDYVQAGIPQLCVNYPEYAALQQEYQVACMIKDVEPESIRKGLRKLLDDDDLHYQLSRQARAAAKVWNWDNEKLKLVRFWQNVFPLN